MANYGRDELVKASKVVQMVIVGVGAWGIKHFLYDSKQKDAIFDEDMKNRRGYQIANDQLGNGVFKKIINRRQIEDNNEKIEQINRKWGKQK